MRFPLAAKLTIAFAAVALVPIAAVAVVAQELVEARYRADWSRALDGAAHAVDLEYGRAAKEVQRTLERVARVDDPQVGQVLLDLGKGGLDEERQRALVHRAPAEMRALGLDVYELTDGDGTILAAGHYSGRAGQSDPAAQARAQRHPGAAVLVSERVAGGAGQRQALAIEAAQTVQTDFAKVTVVVGRELGAPFLERLRLPEGEVQVRARLVGGDGQTLAASAGGFPEKSYPRRTITLPGDEPAPRVEVEVLDEDLGRALSWIRIAAAAVALGGLVLAILLGALVARRIARPLGELAEGARRVAAGDLAGRVRVRTGDEVGELAATFNAMVGDLGDARERLVHAERVAAWREIARRIAHEVKNPLTPIQMAVETLQRVRRAKPELFDGIFDESSRTILEEVARLKHIVSEFSSFARMPEPKMADLEVREVVEGALALYRGAEAAGLTVVRELDPERAQVRADKDQLQQVLLNLLENARDALASAGAGTVTVRTRRAGQRVEVEVADSGPGIADEARARLFTPYFTTKPQGTGLGLAIVHRIVTDHGGEIRVASAPGQGAVFTICLPAI